MTHVPNNEHSFILCDLICFSRGLQVEFLVPSAHIKSLLDRTSLERIVIYVPSPETTPVEWGYRSVMFPA